ncbi:MAG: bifunctional diaminohydroxyphosphoribosylaminopyrimidine deaminase/5-amino-6-(5-phosphoribosylamino)uracil reductase RibD, partial [Smithellaceae bacterium]
MNDEFYMNLALKLAAKGRGYASPNPMVGAVLVKHDRIIGQGYHQCCGKNHAEVNAIENTTESAEGSTLYVTLEPCCHHGKTPPCTDRIIKDKIARVVIGTGDSNPRVSCQGIRILQQNGIEVKSGVLEKACRTLNEVFFHYMETGLPFVTIKYASTLDGRIATACGRSQWISSPPSLKFVHRLRARHDAILVGVGTVLLDDPELTVRLVRGRNPVRIVVDSHLKIPDSAKLIVTAAQITTIIATTRSLADPRAQDLSARGAQILTIDADAQGRVDLAKLLKALAARNISSLLVEGGSQIITSFLRENLVNRL